MIHVTTVPVKTQVNKTKIPGADFAINPYIGCPHKCIYCYAEYMRKFTGHSEAWGDFLDVKLCNRPLEPGQLFHTKVLLSSVTDPYNPFEKIYEKTRSLLLQLIPCQAYVSILTKSSLVLRDIDMLKQLPQCKVIFSFTTLDESLRQRIEPFTSTIDEKIKALQTLHENGIDTGIMVAPIFPHLTNWRQIVEQTSSYTNNYLFDRLNMRSFLLHRLMDFIEIHYPSLLAAYSEIFVQENSAYYEQLAHEISHYCQEKQLSYNVFF